MYSWIAAAANTVTVVTVVVILGVRLEHRMTKMETDICWLKRFINKGCGKETDDEKG